MPLKKIRDLAPSPWERDDFRPCMNPDHNFPSHIYLTPGVWEHTCSGCGARTTVTVPLVICSMSGGGDR